MPGEIPPVTRLHGPDWRDRHQPFLKIETYFQADLIGFDTVFVAGERHFEAVEIVFDGKGHPELFGELRGDAELRPEQEPSRSPVIVIQAGSQVHPTFLPTGTYPFTLK